MRPIGLVLLLAMVVAGTGCTRSGDTDSKKGQDGAERAMFANAKPVVLRPEVVNPEPASVSTARKRTDRTVELLLTTGAEPCGILQRVEVHEGDESIRVAAFLGTDPAAFKDGVVTCPSGGIPATTTVRLRQPVGDRRIVDDTSGQPIRLIR
jgi:hypothetical protein